MFKTTTALFSEGAYIQWNLMVYEQHIAYLYRLLGQESLSFLLENLIPTHVEKMNLSMAMQNDKGLSIRQKPVPNSISSTYFYSEYNSQE